MVGRNRPGLVAKEAERLPLHKAKRLQLIDDMSGGEIVEVDEYVVNAAALGYPLQAVYPSQRCSCRIDEGATKGIQYNGKRASDERR